MKLLEVVDLKKYFPLGKLVKRKYVKAVDGVSFQMDRGEILGVLGESGCGKSTLGLVLSRLELETSGEIKFDGVDLSGNLKLDRETRRRIQIIFQNPYDSFDPRLTIGDSLKTPLKIHFPDLSDSEVEKTILDFLDKSGFESPRSYLRRYPHELSGGQLQRISVIRAMMLKPDFLIADECVSMLDVSVRADVINLLMDLVESMGTSMMFITHDISLGKYVSDRIAVMYLGRIVEMGPAKKVVENPVHPYTKILISHSPSIKKKREKIKPRGDIDASLEIEGCKFAPRCPFAEKECFKVEPELVEIERGHFAACFKKPD